MMISLPSKWIKENKLGKGSEIDLEEENNKIVIGTKTRKKGEIVIEINKENEKDIKNILTHIYRNGFDKIIINGIIKEASREIRETVNDLLLGFEVTEISKDTTIIENISEPTEQKYEIILSKLFKIIEETQEIIISSFKENNFKSQEDIEDLRKQHDRFILFCRRLLNKGNTGKNSLIHWELLTFLMHIEHSYFYLYSYLSKNKMKKNEKIIKLMQEAKEYFLMYKHSYYDKDIKLIHKINDLKKEYYLEKLPSLIEKSNGKETVALAYIREIFRFIQIGTSPILNELFENQSASEK